MNKTVNKFLLTRYKFIPELYIRQPEFTYSDFGPFTKHYDRIQKFRETVNTMHIYQNELDKACFAHNTAYSYSKGFAKRTISDKILKDRAYEIVINSKDDGYQTGLVNILYNCFDKKTWLGAGASVNEELAQELHKPVIKNFKRWSVYARFKDNIWTSDLAQMSSSSSKNWGVKYLLCEIDVFTKYA